MQRNLQHAEPQAVTRSERADQIVCRIVEVIDQDCRQIILTNAALFEVRAIAIFRQVRLAAKSPAASFDTFVKRQVFISVQRVVMNENRNRSLRRQQVRSMLDGMVEFGPGCVFGDDEALQTEPATRSLNYHFRIFRPLILEHDTPRQLIMVRSFFMRRQVSRLPIYRQTFSGKQLNQRPHLQSL